MSSGQRLLCSDFFFFFYSFSSFFQSTRQHVKTTRPIFSRNRFKLLRRKQTIQFYNLRTYVETRRFEKIFVLKLCRIYRKIQHLFFLRYLYYTYWKFVVFRCLIFINILICGIRVWKPITNLLVRVIFTIYKKKKSLAQFFFFVTV